MNSSENKTQTSTHSSNVSRVSSLQKKQALPYCGPNGAHVPGNSTRWYGSDSESRAAEIEMKKDLKNISRINPQSSGTWEYYFNSLGFRGPEYEPNAEYRVLYGGDSNTFGEGIPWEANWTNLLTKRLRENGLLKSVSMINTAQGGAPNDYIARSVITQAAAIQPQLVVVFFSHTSRKEHVEEEKIFHIGPWSEDELAERYYSYYSDHDGLINTLQNMLLVQYFCQSHNIEYHFTWTEGRLFEKSALMKFPLCAHYLSLLDMDCFMPCVIFKEDFGRDAVHPGPIGHSKLADAFYARLRKACQ